MTSGMVGDASISSKAGPLDFWIPPLTTGYIFTITGEWHHFVLAILAAPGSRYLLDLYGKIEGWVEEVGDPAELDINRRFGERDWGYSFRRKIFISAFWAVWLITTIWGLYLLYVHFDHSDPVIVGPAGISWVVLSILLMK